MKRPIISIFGSNWPEPKTSAYEDAWQIGKGLAQAGFTICTGGYKGTMLAASEGARSAGGEVIGVTVEAWGPCNTFVTQHVVCEALLPRLNELVCRAEGYVILPGGTGTLLEIALVLEYQFKGTLTPRPMWFLGTQWQPVIRCALKDQAHGRKWVAGETRLPTFKFFESPEGLLSDIRLTLGS